MAGKTFESGVKAMADMVGAPATGSTNESQPIKNQKAVSRATESACVSEQEKKSSEHCMLAPFTAGWQMQESEPLIISKGEGVYVWDSKGNKYIDALAGLWCTALGFSEKRLVKAAEKQLNILPFYHSFWNRTSQPTLNVQQLQNVGVMPLLQPLLLDLVPEIQQMACSTLCHMAGYNPDLAEAMVQEGIVVQLLLSLREAYRLNKAATTSVLRAIAKHSAPLSQMIVDMGGIPLLILVLDELDPAVKEIAAGALGHIARHTPQLAQAVVDAGVLKPFVICIQDYDLQLRRTTIASLADIARHTAELGKEVADIGVVPIVAKYIEHPNQKLKSEVCAVLHCIAKHTKDLAEEIVSAEVFPKLFLLLKDSDPSVRKNSAALVCEVCKHTKELSQLILAKGGVPALVDNVSEVKGNERLPGVMALGYIASFSDALSAAVISSNALLPLHDALANESEDHIKGASAWSLGQIGKHSPVHAKGVAEAGVMPKLLIYALSKSSSDDLQSKCEKSIEVVCKRLTHFPALDSMLQGPPIPDSILKYILAPIAKLVVHDVELRTKLVLSGTLSRLNKIQPTADDRVKELIDKINNVYPSELLHFYAAKLHEIRKPLPTYDIIY